MSDWTWAKGRQLGVAIKRAAWGDALAVRKTGAVSGAHPDGTWEHAQGWTIAARYTPSAADKAASDWSVA